MSIIEDSVCVKIQERVGFGLAKYGVTLERSDLTTLDWLIHAQEEAMDLANYLEVLINRERARKPLLVDEAENLSNLLLHHSWLKRSPEMSWKIPLAEERLDYGS
jgi:hypothetical protein